MITEDYVSFETAKLLKEKGFDAECHSHYYPCHYPDGSIQYHKYEGTDSIKNGSFYKIYSLKNLPKCHYLAPTLQMAMKWLREVRNLSVEVHFLLNEENDASSWNYDIIDTITYCNKAKYDMRETFKTFEQACESAIKYCLENLI